MKQRVNPPALMGQSTDVNRRLRPIGWLDTFAVLLASFLAGMVMESALIGLGAMLACWLVLCIMRSL